MPKLKSSEISTSIGIKIRQLRKINNWSQKQLAEKLGITFQQLQKYERGLNKISVDRLDQLASIFKYHIYYFFLDDSKINSGLPPVTKRTQ